MSTTACAQPGCTGSILDGYCDVCGSPGPASAGPSGAAATSTGIDHRWRPRRCTQPGCSGTIVDGYCDVCGSPGPQGATPAGGRGRGGTLDTASVATMPAGVAQSPSTVSRDVRPARHDGARLGARRRRRQQGHPAGRHVLDPAARSPARRRA